VQSGVANAISQVCQKYGTVYFNTNSSSTTESGENCHRTKFMWDGNADNFALAIVRAGMDRFGKKWLLLTNDYVWGRDASAATRKTLDRFGGSVVDEIMVPVGTRDFSAILLKAQQIKPDVVAPAVGGDDYKALRQQIIDQGLQEKLIFSGAAVPDWPDAYPLGRGGVFGAFPTTWYHYLDLPGVPEFVQAFKKRWPDAPEPVPGNVFYNTYYAMRELFRAIERAGSTNNIKVIKQLEGLKMPARERMQHFDAWIDPASHHVQQTVYVGTQNAKPRDDTDLFSIVAWAKPEDVRSDTEKSCKLESYGDTPTYEM
jgi:branched-chain amino acid transport system substrate-binding protein